MSAAFKEIAKLRQNAKEFETFWARYREHIAKPSIDKFDAKFSSDGRWGNFKVVAFFESYSGAYGNSSCGQFGRFDADLAHDYMIRAMNCMQEELFAKCAELMKIDAAKKVDAARAEVEAMNAALDACLAEAPAEGGAA
ncbi:hypothetical protein [Cereibacter changlensis]|uniref:hypothetical protein n=1 Tax=Cereibacter changlensis TaxID=402884 RepID=UPI004033A287